MVPNSPRVGVLFAPAAPSTPPQLRQVEEAAANARITIHPVGVPERSLLEHAFAELSRERVGGLVALSSAPIVSWAPQIVELTKAAKLPTIFPYPNFARHGV
jgi:ABC-type uncharacterized transport system substrate-binding protein